MSLLQEFLGSELPELLRHGIRLRVIGEISSLPPAVRRLLSRTMNATEGNTGMTLTLGISYAGRDEIVRAARALAADAAEGTIRPEAVTEDVFASRLDTAGMPDPDLVIRTSGEIRSRMKRYVLLIVIVMVLCFTHTAWAAAPLGLPPVPIPPDNPQSPEKIALGEKLFNDKRFSSTGEVNCATCHKKDMAFTDRLKVSEGINKLTGTRNAPTVINAAYMHTQFWDGREPSLEEQSGQPPINPVEMGLADYTPILRIVRSDPEYADLFKKAFGKTGEQITLRGECSGLSYGCTSELLYCNPGIII